MEQIIQVNLYPAKILCAEMLSACYICCINSNALQHTFTLEANIMNPDQTAPKGAV